MIKLIDENEELKHSLPFTDIKRTRELNGEDSLDFETTEKIEEGKRIVFKDEQGIWNEYIIQEVKILHDGEDITYLAYCESSMNELFGHFILDMKPRNAKASAILTNILKGTRFKAGLVEDTNVKSFNIYHTNVKAAIWKLLDIYGLDISVEIKVSIGEKSRITDRIINLSKHLGDFEGKRYTYKKDLRSIKKTIDYTNIATLLYGYGKGEEVVGDDGKPTGGYGRKINFAEYNKGKQYITNEKARKLYGVGKNRLHIEGVYENSECEDKKELLELTRKELEKRSKPKISYELSVEDLSKYEGYKFEAVGLGDDVVVIDDEIKTAVYTRVVKIVDSPFSNNDTEITLGNYVKDISEEFIEYEKLRNTIENRNQELGEEIKKLAQATDKGFLKSVVDRLNGELNATGGYVYFKQGEGILILNAPIDGNPSQAINLKGGMISIANKKKANSQWDWTTFGTGNGFTASVIVAGILRGGRVRWNLEDGTLLIGNDPTDYNLYWDGSTLHLRNVDIDLENNRTIQDLKNKQGMTDKEIAARKEEIESAKKDLQEAKTSLEGSISEVSNNVGDLDNRLDQQDEKNKLVSKDILDLKTNLKITDGKIQTRVESINKTVEEKIRANSNYIDEKDKALRTYLNNNYSSISQTDEKISSEVGKIQIETEEKIRLGDNNLKSYITQNYTTINQTNEKIEATVKSFKDDMSKYESRFTQLKDEISLQVSSSKQSGVYKNLIKYAWKWASGHGIYWYPDKDDKGVAQGGGYYIESNGDLRFTSNKKANTWTVFDFSLLEMEGGIKEYTVICEPSEMKDTLQYPQFQLRNKNKDIITNYPYFNKKDRVYKLVVKDDKLNELPYWLKIYFKDSQAGTDKDRSVVIPQGKLALVKGWHPNLTWNEVYTPNEQAIEELRSELKVKADEISASVKNKVKGLESKISIQADRISSKVSRGDVISEINQSPEQIKIKASKIDLTGNVSVRGDFATYDGYGDIGVEISYNRVRWRDNRWENKTFGEINVVKNYSGDYNYTFNIGHFKTGRTTISYNDGSSWYPYVTFDRWNYTGNGGPSHPVCFNEGVRFKGECKFHSIIHFDHMRLREYTNGIALENYDGNGLMVDRDGSVWITKGSRRYEVEVK